MTPEGRHDVIIVGAGLSGLTAADHLTRANLSVRVLEARDRIGGRTLSVPLPDGASTWSDLGGAWTRPHHTQVRQLATELGVTQIEQYVEGDGLLDLGAQGHQRLPDPSPMTGTTRFLHGAQALSHGLAARLPSGSVELNAVVTAIEVTPDGVTVQVRRAGRDHDAERLSARAVIVALPPRLVATTLTFVPELSADVRRVLLDLPTWMGHAAKVFVRYDRPFWREQRLSGFAVGGVGPLEEIHDVSSPDGHFTALFGFLAAGPTWRELTLEQRRQAVLAQLARLFGPEALEDRSYHEKDWVREGYTSSVEDVVATPEDFGYGHTVFEEAAFEGRVFWAGTETSAVDGGRLEGAVRAGRRAARLVEEQLLGRSESLRHIQVE